MFLSICFEHKWTRWEFSFFRNNALKLGSGNGGERFISAFSEMMSWYYLKAVSRVVILEVMIPSFGCLFSGFMVRPLLGIWGFVSVESKAFTGSTELYKC